jgi:AcrR family transcriptional regulator
VAGVLRATLEELGRVGYGRLRIDAIAARSGVNKTTIYRRWPEKAHLVCAALKTVGGPPGDPDTGSVRADLIESFRSSMRGWTTARGRGLLRVLAVERADDTVDRIARVLRGRYETARRAMLARAIARGELPPSLDVDLFLDVVTGAVLTRVRNHRGPLDADWLARVIDFTLAAARAPASTPASRLSSAHRS